MNWCSSLHLRDLLSKEARVEVAKDGLKGRWFEARIVDPPRNPQSDLKEDRVTLVEYQRLFSADGDSRLLVEKADSNFIRPSPPPENPKEPLELKNLVDAFYQDAWWPVVIASETENGRYLVTFEEPHFQMELDRADLRVHWDWTAGVWVLPNAKDSLPPVLHEQVSENQRERSLLIEETTLTSINKRKRGRPRKVLSLTSINKRKKGRPRKVLSDENTNASFSPVGEKTNPKGKEMNPEPEATLKNCAATAEENRPLPLSKTLPDGFVDFMEALKKYPQKPHFAPLREGQANMLNKSEAYREGQAIAHMVTFSILMEKALGLNCCHPKRSFDECLEALNDLKYDLKCNSECHGFDIKPIELHIKKMLLTKEQQEIKELSQLSQENEKINEEIENFSKKVKVLESKRGKNELKLEMLSKITEDMRKTIEQLKIDGISSS